MDRALRKLLRRSRFVLGARSIARERIDRVKRKGGEAGVNGREAPAQQRMGGDLLGQALEPKAVAWRPLLAAEDREHALQAQQYLDKATVIAAICTSCSGLTNLLTKCKHSGRKRLRFFADGAAKKWPLRGSLKLG